MKTVQTPLFSKWLKALKDRKAVTQIAIRIARVEAGNFGDVKSIGGGVSEFRVNSGPGYRVYFTRRAGEIVILLCGGDKGSQQRDIAKAKEMAAQID